MAQQHRISVDNLRPTAQAGLKALASVRGEERVKLSDEVAKVLKSEGVEYAFFLTGGGTATMMRGIEQSGIKAVHCRNEMTAGFAMDAWGRLTTRPGFALPGAGTGLTNFTTGLCQAYSAPSPGVAIIAESGPFDDDKYGGQGIARSENQCQGLCKWVRKAHPNTFLWQLKRAFRSAVTSPIGPVVVAYGNSEFTTGITVPRRVAYQALDPNSFPPRVFRNLVPQQEIEAAIKWLLDAEKPVIIAGHEAHQDQCQEEFRELAHLLGVPSAGRRIARGIISETDPLNYGRRGRGAVFAQADRCIVLGLRIGSLEGFGNPPFFPHTIRYCQIHNSPDYTELNLPTDLELIGNLKDILQQMIQTVKDMGIKGPVDKWAKWRQFIVDTNQSYEKRTLARTEGQASEVPINPDIAGRYVSEVLADMYKNDYIFINDSHTGGAYFSNWNIAINTGTVMDASETIGIGHAPGMALAAGLATKREKPILAMVGDGCCGIAAGDFETCTRWDIPVVFLHHNNNTMINATWELTWAKTCTPTGDILKDSWQTLPGIRYDKMFAEVGQHPEYVERAEEIKAVVKRAFEFAMKEKKPAFIEMPIEPFALHTSQAQPGRVLAIANEFKWNELPDRGKEMVVMLATPEVTARLPKEYQEGIAAAQKK
jgi:thiamine pyrophosphate-dependent acetolactate synthase large subunit-like protein